MRDPTIDASVDVAVAKQVLKPFIKNGGWMTPDPPRRDLAALTEADALAGKLAPPRKRKRGDRSSFGIRHLLVVEAVRRVCGLGFHLQRSAHTLHRTSASAIVARALADLGVHMDDRSIENLCRKACRPD